MDIHARLAKNLRRMREERGLSQEAFAFEAGIHRTYISDLERARRNPSLAVLERIAIALSVSASDLLD